MPEERRAFGIGAEFNIVDDGDGTLSASGTWRFEHFGFDGPLRTYLCYEQFDFAADFERVGPVRGCDETGNNCVQICPYVVSSQPEVPVGSCLGHFSTLTGDSETYVSDCELDDPTTWFHPEGDKRVILETFLFSLPVESDLPIYFIGQDQTWGEWADMQLGDFPGHHPALQVQRIDAHRDGQGRFIGWSHRGGMVGVTLSPDTGASDANGVGEHTLVMKLMPAIEP